MFGFNRRTTNVVENNQRINTGEFAGAVGVRITDGSAEALRLGASAVANNSRVASNAVNAIGRNSSDSMRFASELNLNNNDFVSSVLENNLKRESESDRVLTETIKSVSDSAVNLVSMGAYERDNNQVKLIGLVCVAGLSAYLIRGFL